MTNFKGLGAAAIIVLAGGAAACGNGYGGSSGPAGPTSAPAGAIVIEIVGTNGARSFSPNPSTIPVGQTVSWHNADSVTHRVVLDDRQIDTGDLAPGAFSAALTLRTPGPYHCTIHPEMIGTIEGAR